VPVTEKSDTVTPSTSTNAEDCDGASGVPCDSTVGSADQASPSVADGNAISEAISALVAAGPEEGDSCPLLTSLELTEALGPKYAPFLNTDYGAFATTESRRLERDGFGDSVFCYFSRSEGAGSANVFVFTDTSAGLDGIVELLEANDLGGGSGGIDDFSNAGEFAGGTGYVKQLEDDFGELTGYGLWIASDGSWGLSQYATLIDQSALQQTVARVQSALS
jgi:hypothetical protein